MGFNLDDYEPVADRLARFWAEHPAGRLATTIDRMVDGGAVIMRAEVYRDAADPYPAATGYAEEVRTDRGVNSTSWVENAETSAIGRALANLGYAPKGARPSREEMAKAQRSDPGERGERFDRPAAVVKLNARADAAGLTAQQRRTRLWAAFGKEHLAQLSDEELRRAWKVWGPSEPGPDTRDVDREQVERDQEAMADATGTGS